MKGSLLGIEIGGTKLQLALGNSSGEILQKQKLAVDLGRGAQGIREQIAAEIGALKKTFTFAGVGVGFGGPVDWRTGKIARSHQVEGWSGFDLKGWVESLAGAPVSVENDANIAALGEAACGAGKGIRNVFYVTLGSGVGGGLVVDGQIYHGASPGEAEIGHLRVDRSGTILEEVCSGWAVDRRIVEAAKQREGVLRELTRDMKSGHAAHLAAALAAGDPGAERIFEETVETLAFGLSHVIHLFHPDVIVLGGGLSGIGEPLRAGVERAVDRFTMEVFKPVPVITLSALGENAVPVGALVLAR
jgi:glucokinase